MIQSRRRRRGRGQLGQAAVETAIVMPLFVFLILGIIQLALMHQARSMVKYAAFKAARAGIMHHADTATMEAAALAALLPVISYRPPGSISGPETLGRTDSSVGYIQKMSLLKGNSFSESGSLKHVEIRICAPTKNMATKHTNRLSDDKKYVSFDKPMEPGVSWEEFEVSKLAVQATLNYRMFIPFVNRVIFYISRGQEAEHKVLFKDVVRMGGEPTGITGPQGDSSENARRQLASSRNVYVVPIRASYALRMQSDLIVSKLKDNECIF